MRWWNRTSPVKLAMAFVEACNARDAAALNLLLDEDFTFEDSRGGTIRGRSEMLAALVAVQSVAPDLRVEIDSAVRRGDSVLLTGRSITSNECLAVDTQWRALIRNGRVIEWQAFGRKSERSLVGLLRTLDNSG